MSSGRPSGTPRAVEPPAHIHDHELLCPIGQGSYGEVWLARNAVGTLRAVKIVHRQNFERVEHFEREFKGLQKFEPISRSHDGLVDILQIGRDDAAGYFYYVMELADPVGEAGGKVGKWESGRETPSTNALPHPLNPANYTPKTLRSLLSPAHFPTCPPASALSLPPANPIGLPVAGCIEIGLALASALEHLHKSGLVHRDIKPSNIIFVNGAPKLADIGLVAHIDDARSLVGTAGYIPPEGPGSARADLYSLGKVLYEISLGKDRQDFPQLPPDLQSHPDHAALLELNEVVLKACETDFRNRYQSAQQIHDDLVLLQRGESIKHQRTMERRVAITKRITVAGAIVAVLVTAGWLLSKRFSASTVQSLTEAQAAPKSIAVLPFDNDSTIKADEYLGTQMAEELSTALAKIPELRVMGRSTAAAVKAGNDTPRSAREFKLTFVLDGRVQKTDSQLRVTAQLVEPVGDSVLWSEAYNGEIKDAFGIQSDIAQKAVQAMGVRLTESAKYRLALKSTKNWEAYQLYLEARHWWSRRTVEGVRTAAELFERVTALDTNFARAYAGLADCYSVMPDLGAMASRDAWPKAKAAATRAVELDNTLAETYTSLGMSKRYADWDWAGAERAFKRALELEPDYPTARQWYAQLLNTLQRPDEAIAQIKRAIELDPQSDHLLWNLVLRYCYARQFDRAVETWRKLLHLDSDKARGFKMLWVFERTGTDQEAIPLWERQLAVAGATQAEIEALRDAKAVRGMKVYWEKQLELCLDRPERNLYAVPYDIAHIYTYLGKHVQALDWLERAYDERSPFLTYLAADPLYDPLRSEPRFIALLEKVGLEGRMGRQGSATTR